MGSASRVASMKKQFDLIETFTGNISRLEGEALANYASIAPGNILEIGAYMGKSTSYLSVGAGPKNVYTIDLWDFRKIGYEKRAKDNEKATLRGWHKKETYNQFVKNITLIKGCNVLPVQGISQEIGKIWKIPLGMLFIDGAHDYNSAMADYRGFSKHILENGILAFHDYVIDDVRRVIDENVIPSGLWTDFEIIDKNLFIARKIK